MRGTVPVLRRARRMRLVTRIGTGVGGHDFVAFRNRWPSTVRRGRRRAGKAGTPGWPRRPADGSSPRRPPGTAWRAKPAGRRDRDPCDSVPVAPVTVCAKRITPAASAPLRPRDPWTRA